ncbi:MAG: hypothetical protein Q9166_004739 [cf. Caloplaca sp. 2 TL-2023]
MARCTLRVVVRGNCVGVERKPSLEVQSTMAETGDDNEDSSTSDSTASEDDSGKASSIRKELKATFSGDKGTGAKGQSPLLEIQEYDDHSEQLHRHHRGLMQWKVRLIPSTMD